MFYDRSLKRLRLYNLPPFDGKEAATMVFEENVPGCLIEGVDYEAEAISGLLEAGDPDKVQMMGENNNDRNHVDDNKRQSVQLN
jgi:hypothetical protein